jgi:antitoxin VapB
MVYTYFSEIELMTKRSIAKLFRNGRSQAVRLPREFRFSGNCVSIRRLRKGVLLEPLAFDAAEWFKELDRLGSKTFPARRNKPKTPRRDIFE